MALWTSNVSNSVKHQEGILLYYPNNGKSHFHMFGKIGIIHLRMSQKEMNGSGILKSFIKVFIQLQHVKYLEFRTFTTNFGKLLLLIFSLI